MDKVHDLEKGNTAAGIDAQTKLNALYKDLAAAKDAGNIAAYKTLEAEIARVSESADKASATTAHVVDTDTHVVANREAAAMRRDAAARADKTDNERNADRAIQASMASYDKRNVLPDFMAVSQNPKVKAQRDAGRAAYEQKVTKLAYARYHVPYEDLAEAPGAPVQSAIPPMPANAVRIKKG